MKLEAGRTVFSLLAMGMLGAGCSSEGASVGRDSTGDTLDTSRVEVPGELGAVDLPMDVGAELEPDFGTPDLPDAAVGCLPGDGCFMDPCEGNGQCLSGWCLEHMGEGVCSMTCEDECPSGWTCRQVAGGPDLVFACVSDLADLCRPCVSGGDCKSTGDVSDACVSYGVEGSFCGGDCGPGKQCPPGFSCKVVTSVDGLTSSECVADAGVCGCTLKSAASQLWTPCLVENELGVCKGKRVCTGLGLTDCDAKTPAAEECNNIDDDCDGDTDEGTCDDGNQCTQDTCEPTKGCQHKLLNGTECMDGNPCTAADHCAEGVCVGTPVLCDDDNPCTDDKCDGAGGCSFAPNQDACDDADPCTVGDACKAGKCSGTKIACECKVDADCLPLEDGDLCNGSLYCDNSKAPFQCAVNAKSVVECPAPAGLDAICQKAECDPDTGACSLVPFHEGFACSDGDACTIGDLCFQGACAAGTPLNCNDGDLCTDDSCDVVKGCQHANNSAPCQDGDACTVGDVCQNGSCTPGTKKSCDDGNPCTDDSCQPASGCVSTPNVAACDDGNKCTTGDHCSGGKCVVEGQLDCHDGNGCTKDWCDMLAGCQYSPASLPCDDSNKCTLGDMCKDGACVAGLPMDCDDGNPCTEDACESALGCVSSFNAADCDDNNDCTTGDHCVQGVCKGTGTLTCDDDNPCTKDICLPDGGCLHQSLDIPCTDGDVCTLDDHCDAGVCVPGAALQCDDSNPCTDDACAAGKGCTFSPNNALCDDQNACTVSDSCVNGSCAGKIALDCHDGVTCTADSCDPDLGCIYDLITPCCGNAIVEPPEECDDGNNDNDDECMALCKLPSCDDGVHNGQETDQDCGGPECPKCDVGKICLGPGDCESQVCLAGKCVKPLCEDGVHNGDETDVDCGGPTCQPCGHGKNCKSHSDCVYGALCTGGVCSLWGTGQDGDLNVSSGTVTINTGRSFAQGSSGQSTLTIDPGVQFASGNRVIVHQTTGPGAGAWEENLVKQKEGAQLQLEKPLKNSYVTSGNTRAQVVLMPQYKNVTVSGGTLTAPAWDGTTGGILAFSATGKVDVQGGSISMTSRGFRGAGHGCTYRCQNGLSGESPSGPSGTGTAPSANGIAGGGGQAGQDCAAGGGGGYGTQGGTGTDGSKGACHQGNHLGGQGGAASGDADTSESIFLGGAGGEGGGDEDGGYPGKGGNGGGIVVFKAPTVAIGGGYVTTDGEPGAHGYQGCGSGGGMGGGGGGAGGGVYIASDSANLNTSHASAQGSPGGKCGPSNDSYPGGAGGNGRIGIRSPQIQGSTSPIHATIN